MSLRTRKGEKIRSYMSCITVTPHSPTLPLKKDSEAAGGGLGFHCENFGVLNM